MSGTFEGWAIVELMGHRRLAGFVTEEEHFGTAMLRLDVHGLDDSASPGVTQALRRFLGVLRHPDHRGHRRASSASG